MDLAALQASVDRHREAPIDYMRWSAWQRRFLADSSRARVVKCANQIGKTTVGAADLIYFIRGGNPYRDRPYVGPVNCMLLSKSIQQINLPGGILSKLWEMLPKSEIDPALRFVPGKGLMGIKDPTINFVDGPGIGSSITIRTYRQPPENQAGATLHGVWCDEPLPEHIYSELWPRILKNEGFFSVLFTATRNMPPQGYLRNLCAEPGQPPTLERPFVLHEAAVAVRRAGGWEPVLENVWPEGNARPFMTERQILSFVNGVPEFERPMRVEGSWDGITEGAWLSQYGDSCVRAFEVGDLPNPAGIWVQVGIDHGEVPGKQAFVLELHADRLSVDPKCWVFGEYVPEHATSADEDAHGLLEMLREALCPNVAAPEGWAKAYQIVDGWVGDRSTGEDKRVKTKSNERLRAAIARLLNQRCGWSLRDERLRTIRVPKKRRGSVFEGMSLVNGMCSRGNFIVHPRCKHVDKACRTFAGDPHDPVKDVLDAARYGVEDATTNTRDGAIIRGKA